MLFAAWDRDNDGEISFLEFLRVGCDCHVISCVLFRRRDFNLCVEEFICGGDHRWRRAINQI